MRRKLSTSAFPEIDLMSYKGLARKTLSDLFQAFFNTIFIYSHPNSFPAQMDTLVRQLRNLDAKGLPDCDLLRTLSLELNAIVKTFEPPAESPESPAPAGAPSITDDRPVQTWMDKDVFEPDNVFEEFLCALDKSSFFGEDVSQAIVNNCAVGLFHLKHRLKELTKALTTDVRFAAPAEGADGAEEDVRASDGLILLAKSLKMLFDEPYMRKPSSHRFIASVPEGQVLYWDDKMLKSAKELCEQYEAFATTKVGGLPVVLQESFRLIARNNLHKNLASLIAQAQNFLPMPILHNDAAAEELIRSRTANLRTIYPEMLKLLEILNYESVSFFYISLRDLLLETNYELLTQLNELLKKLGPYHIWDPSFSWWDGKSSPAYHAYGVKDAQDLNSFLNIQNQQVINLAINLAKPVVDFLTSDIMLAVNPLDNTKLTKWRRIVDQVTAFQKKQPGNSIAELETFITSEFKEYSLENVFEKINLSDIHEEVGDHFLETRQYIKKGILGRIEILTRQKNIKNYQDLAAFFNKHLKGRFPFTPPATDVSLAEEADPEDVRLFFEKFVAYGGSTEKILDQIYQLGGVATEAIKFLRSAEQVFRLFRGYLETNGTGLPTITTAAEFNINRERAVCANYVAQWALRANHNETVQNTDKNKQTKWEYGSATEVSFRWPLAKGLLELPLNDPKQPALMVLQTTATFSYKGKWSLLRMIRQHLANKGEYLPMFNPDMVVLKFVIPVAENKSAILFDGLTFWEPSDNPNMPGKAVGFPTFPTHAPGFSEEIERYRNEAVLSFERVRASELS
jgi:type VI secretion system protein ImpL